MHTSRSATAIVTLASLLWVAPVTAAPSPVALEGRILAVDGRAATGHTVVLVDAAGTPVARATTDAEGDYAFGSVPAGDYAVGVETPAGELAPMAAPPVRLGDRPERRDLKLMQASSAGAQLGADYGLGMWWAGLSPAGKTWVVVAVVAAVGLTYAALDDDDEPAASPSDPDSGQQR